MALQLPTAGTHYLEYSLTAVTVASLGHLGTVELAAASISNMTSNVIAWSLIQGFCTALDTLCPQAYTSRPKDTSLYALRTCVLLVLLAIPQTIFLWNGERILPEGFAKFVSTLAPAWKADGRPIYGGFFWLNGDGRFAAPKEAYFMAGAGGQYTLIVPSHELVIARLGHFSGGEAMLPSFNRALKLLVEAVPQRK